MVFCSSAIYSLYSYIFNFFSLSMDSSTCLSVFLDSLSTISPHNSQFLLVSLPCFVDFSFWFLCSSLMNTMPCTVSFLSMSTI